jgi:hypothetical protein
MPEPHPNLGSFLTFSNASLRARRSLVSRLRDQGPGDYNPATDFWRRMRDAVKTDRRTSRDGAAVRAAADNATESKKSSFHRVADQWEKVIPQWSDSDFEAPLPGVANLGGLQISVTPRFTERWSNGHRQRVFVYFNAAPLSGESVDVALRVIQLAYAGFGDESPALVDVQRGATHTELLQPVHLVNNKLAELSEDFLMRWAA